MITLTLRCNRKLGFTNYFSSFPQDISLEYAVPIAGKEYFNQSAKNELLKRVMASYTTTIMWKI